jgi:hypothetical protein
MKKIYSILTGITLCIACSSPTNTRVTANSLYTINLDTIPEIQYTMLSSIFKKVKTIILETTSESVIGGISNLQIFKNYIFILDSHSPHKLFVFDTEGRFIRIVGDIGHGPGEYLQPNDFTIDPEKEEIYLLYAHTRINKYNIEGKFIEAVKLDKNFANYIQFHNGKLYVNSYDGYMLKEIEPETGKETNRFLKTDEYNKGWNEPSFRSNGEGFISKLSKSPKFKHLFTDTFIALNNNQVEPYITLQSEHLVTYSDVERAKKSEKEFMKQMNMLREENKIFSFRFYFETENHIFFAYIHEHKGRRGNGVLLDLQTKSAIKTLPFNDLVFIPNTNIHLPLMHYAFYTPEGVYEWLDIQTVHGNFVNFFENVKNGDLSPDLDKLEELKKLTEDSNPVIFYYSYD